MILAWAIWYKWSKGRLNKQYKPENDRGRKGKSFETKELGTGKSDRGTEKSDSNSNGLRTTERSEILQKTSTDDVGKDFNSNRKNRFFRRN